MFKIANFISFLLYLNLNFWNQKIFAGTGSLENLVLVKEKAKIGKYCSKQTGTYVPISII